MKAAIYARYSSDNQREESIDAQVRAIEEYAKRNGHQIVKVYIDEAKSATTDNRPMFKQMIDDTSIGLFDAIIVHKLDRFSRDRYDSAHYKRILKNNSVRLFSVLENLDDSPESIILESVLEGMAEYYSRNLGREVMKGMKESALKCKHTGGLPPLGFDLDKDNLYIINESEAGVIIKIFHMYLDGYGYKSIADELNKFGYKTKAGNVFSKNSVYDILLNEKYKGSFVFNKRSSKKSGKRNNHTYKAEEDIIRIPGGIPAIIDETTFDKVQSKLKSKVRGPRMTSNNYYLLTGLLFCGECGSSYIGNSYRGGRGGKKYPIYCCSMRDRTNTCKNKAIRQSIIEDFVIDELNKKVFSQTSIKSISEQIIEFAKNHGSENQKEKMNIEAHLAQVNSKIDKLVDAVIEGILDKNIVKAKMETLQGEKSKLESRLLELDFKTYEWLDEDKITKYILKSKEDLKSGDNVLKRKVVETFVQKINIYPDRIDVNFKVYMLSSPLMERGKVGQSVRKVRKTVISSINFEYGNVTIMSIKMI